MAQNKPTALITGASQRVGRAIALGLADHGYDIAVHYNGSHRAADKTVDDLKTIGVNAAAVQANLLNTKDASSLINKASEAMGGKITCLINNASLFEPDNIHTCTAERFQDHMNVHVLAPLLLMQAFSIALNGDDGNVINMIDQRVKRLNPSFMTYTLSKTALWTLTQTAAMALAPTVRVNAVAPGPTLRSIHQTADHFAKETKQIPLQKGPDLNEIVSLMKFILNTPSLTGQMLALDGGQHLAWQTPDYESSNVYDTSTP